MLPKISVPLAFKTLQKNWEWHFLQNSRCRGYLQRHTRLVYANIFLKKLFCLFPRLSDLLPSVIFLLTRIIKTCTCDKRSTNNIKKFHILLTSQWKLAFHLMTFVSFDKAVSGRSINVLFNVINKMLWLSLKVIIGKFLRKNYVYTRKKEERVVLIYSHWHKENPPNNNSKKFVTTYHFHIYY